MMIEVMVFKGVIVDKYTIPYWLLFNMIIAYLLCYFK